jgi:type II secretory pathway pseudopilin PulG
MNVRTIRTGRQKGYLLLSVMLLITVMLLALAVEAPRIAQQIKREKEEELIRRGKEYAVAIKKFYRKNGTYPVSLDQLDGNSNQRFLRKRYKDPMTESGEWKLVHAGEAQIAAPNTPSAPTAGTPGAAGQTGTLNTANPFATTPTPAPSPGGFGASSASGSSGLNTGGLNTGGLNTGGLNTGGLNTGGLQSGNPPGTTQLGTLTVQNIGSGGAGPIVGVVSTSKKTSIKEFNGNAEYDQWLFVYDPRIEQTAGGGGVAIASPVGANGPTALTVGVGVQAAAAGQSAPSGTPPTGGTPPQPSRPNN